MGHLEIILSILGLVISAGIVRLLVVTGYNQKTLEQNSIDIRNIKGNDLEHIYSELGKIKQDVAFIKGKMALRNGSK